MINIGIDRAAKNGDWTTECVCEHLPDGKILVKDFHRYKRTTDIKLEKQNDRPNKHNHSQVGPVEQRYAD